MIVIVVALVAASVVGFGFGVAALSCVALLPSLHAAGSHGDDDG